MPKRNKIELQGLVDRIVDMFFKEKLTQIEIAEKLKAEGWDVSKSGVGRTLLSYSAQMKAYKTAAKRSVAIAKELQNEPGLNISEATVQIAQAKLMDEVQKFENFNELSLKELLKAIEQNSLAQVRIAKVKLEYERGYKNGLFKASEVVENECRKAGISADVIAQFKSAILGLKVDYEETANQ